MTLSGRAWAVVALLLATAAILAVKTRPRPVVNASHEDRGVEPPGLEPKPLHSLRNESLVDGDHFFIRNLVDGPIEARCQLVTASNVRAEPSLPRRVILPARAEIELTVVAQVEPDRHAEAGIECVAMVGDPGAPAPDQVAYSLPFYRGTAFALQQGFNGAYSHHDPQSRFALDLAVPEGTPVIAARAGTVMQVEDDFHGHGTDLEKYGDRANYVRILHADGSMAVYAHLAPGTVIVRPGDHVKAGAFLARAGNTGYTTGPHLHFAVQKNVGLELRSIPFTMAGVATTASP